MKFIHILFAAVFSIALTACSSSSMDFGVFSPKSSALDSSLAPKTEQTSDQKVEAQKAAICSWTSAVGMPFRNPVRTEVNGSNISTAAKAKYGQFDREVVGASKAQACLCSDDEALKAKLQCTR